MTVTSFLIPHLSLLQQSYALSVVANTKETDILRKHGVGTDVTVVPIERGTCLVSDIKALILLYRTLRKGHFDLVQSLTPKAGLLAMAAGWAARIPIRIHWFTGQVWLTKFGVARVILKFADRLIAVFSTFVLVDSHSQRDFLVSEGIIQPVNSLVLGDGSVCGVDGERFRPNSQARESIRASLQIPSDAIILLYLGRLNRDKGVVDLATAFKDIAEEVPRLWLLVVGPDEQNISAQVKDICHEWLTRFRQIGFTDQPEKYMAAADIFCVPSYREGFGSSVIEASACGLPTVATKIYGLVDAVDEGNTGILVSPGQVTELAASIRLLAFDEELRSKIGSRARERAVALYEHTRLTNALKLLYDGLLN